ncbi:SHOCT domain-containing protein [Microbacterium sp. MC2]
MHIDVIEPFPVDPVGLDPSVGMGMPPGFAALFAFIVVLVIAGGVVGVVINVRKYRLLRRAGHDPLTVDAAIAAKILDSELPRAGTAPADPALPRTVEERLAEIDDLHTRGVISADERAAARAAILAG